MGAAMGCCDQPVVTPERTIRRRRLYGVNIQGSTSKMPRIERSQQRFLIDQLPARGVDEVRPLFHAGKEIPIDHMPGFVQQGYM
jgi:hypothetical protein